MGRRLREVVSLIAATPDHELPAVLRFSQRPIVPLLSIASCLYRLLLLGRSRLYRWGVFRPRSLPVPVISVGNLTWGGTGKTPMVEFLARFFAHDARVTPLLLTRGYAGGDEANMLNRHLQHSTAKIGVGADRIRSAVSFIERYGYMNYDEIFSASRSHNSYSEKIGVIILDDGMQHWRLSRSLDILMVNGMMPWGNGHLLPRGPLREPLGALKRADIVVIHNADLVCEGILKLLESTIKKRKELPIFFSGLTPEYLFEVENVNSKLPLAAIHGMVILCISGIGSPNAFVEVIKKLDPLCVERIDFGDHHCIKTNDMEVIQRRVRDLEERFGKKPTVIVTEKDYDRDNTTLEMLGNSVKVLVLHSSLRFVPLDGHTEGKFTETIIQILKTRLVKESLF